MDLKPSKHCLASVIPAGFQGCLDHGIVDYPELERIHKEHQVQLLTLQDYPKNHTTCLRALSKCFLESGKFGAATISFQCINRLAARTVGN